MVVFIIKVASGKQYPFYAESFAEAERHALACGLGEVVSIEKAPSGAKLRA